jgi:hypothetical protein
MPSKKSWADRQGIPKGREGKVVNGIPTSDRNRASNWAFRKKGIQELLLIMDRQYRSKGVNCTLFGVLGGTSVKYAIYVEEGFLVEV